MNKFGRNYKLRVDADDILLSNAINGLESETVLETEPPFTIEFDILRNVLSSANIGTFRVHNLSKERRGVIKKDQYATDIYKGVEFKAGYEKTLPTIFKGNINFAWSVRENTEMITTIEAYDGGFALVNGKTNSSYVKGTSKNAMIRDMQNGLVKVAPGQIGNFPGSISRGNTITGNAGNLLSELTENSFFIDLETSHMLGDNECLRGQIPIITADSGLLSTPRRQNTIVTFDMIFEPRLVIGQKVEINASTIDDALNTEYKVVALHHRGIISEAVSGQAVTTVTLWFGTEQLRTVN